jgi:very-short-patch-repair endonuclease
MTIKPVNRQYSGVIQHQWVSDKKVGQARSLRKKMTSAEKALWAILRGKKCGHSKFRRQQIIEGFIADFFCAQYNLVIEVDGCIHETEEQKARDAHRKKVFESIGLREVRFTNKEVFENSDSVKKRILDLCSGK